MLSDFPKTYRIVRQGEVQDVSVTDTEDLFWLRTELELVRRFGAGSSAGLMSVLNRRVVGLESRLTPKVLTTLDAVREIQVVLRDAMEPANERTIIEIDREYPAIRAGLNMDSIEKDTQAFRNEVVEQASVAGDADIDAMLAAFEEAAREPAAGEAAPDAEALLAAEAQPEAENLDIDAMLAEAESPTPVDPVDAVMAELAQTIDEAPKAEAVAGEAAVVEEAPAAPPAEENPPVMAEAVVADGEAEGIAGIETATERVAETLVNAEQQLEAIASAFETAAAELDNVTSEVGAVLEPATTGCIDIPAGASAEIPSDTAAIEQWEAAPAAQEAAVAQPQEQPPTPSATSPEPFAVPAPVQAPVATPVATPATVSPAVVSMATPVASAASLRTQMQQARANMLVQLDDLLVIIERAERMQTQADESLRRAQEFERAVARTREAGQVLAEAQAESAKAQATFEQAQGRVQAARQAWESAQQQASAVAAQGQRPGC